MNAIKLMCGGLIGLSQLVTTNAFCGSSSGNGGFAFSNSKQLLKTVVAQTAKLLTLTNEECVNREMSRYQIGPVNLEKMKKIIQKTRFSINDEKSRKTVESTLEPLVMNYGIDEEGAYIEALKPFFIGFMLYDDRSVYGHDQENMVADLLLHEAVHHFNYSEKQAGIFVQYVGNHWTPRSPCEAKDE